MTVNIPVGGGLFTIVDREDAAKVVGYPYQWKATKRGTNRSYYVRASVGKAGVVYLHRFLTNCPKNMAVDHINGDGLDNRKSNLRVCTTTENKRNRTRLSCKNTSGVNGVMWNKREKKWRAVVTVNGKKKQMGEFKDKAAAVAARRAGELKYFGEFAPIA